jgi:hypothetical protein
MICLTKLVIGCVENLQAQICIRFVIELSADVMLKKWCHLNLQIMQLRALLQKKGMWTEQDPYNDPTHTT